MDSAVDGIVVADEQGVILSFNRAAQRLFGYSEAEVIGESIGLLMPEPDRSAHRRYIERYLATGDKHVIGIGREVQALRRDGRRMPLYLAVSEFESPTGRCFAAILHDASAEVEARELRDRLVRAERLATLAEMAAALAHEMNQPLAAMAMYAEAARQLAATVSPESPRLVSALDNVIGQAQRASLAVERIRSLFQDGEIRLETVDANTLVSEVVELARTDVRAHGMTIEFVPGEDLTAVECDPVQIQQVVRNLICNAIDAMLAIDCRNGSTVRVASSVLGDVVGIEVRDCGKGIDAQAVDDVFAPFQSSKAGGLGMGLAISRTIILNHGGSLDCENIVDSSGKTIGARFGFTLPRP